MQEVNIIFQNTITLFNFHEATGLWYPSVIAGVDLIEHKSNSASIEGMNNRDTVNILIPCNTEKKITTSQGVKRYIGNKIYAKCNDPANYITFKPEKDFIYEGVWPDLSPIDGEDFDSGLYNELNTNYDGVYMINAAAFYSLLPHFEIGGG